MYRHNIQHNTIKFRLPHNCNKTSYVTKDIWFTVLLKYLDFCDTSWSDILIFKGWKNLKLSIRKLKMLAWTLARMSTWHITVTWIRVTHIHCMYTYHLRKSKQKQAKTTELYSAPLAEDQDICSASFCSYTYCLTLTVLVTTIHALGHFFTSPIPDHQGFKLQ